MNTQPTTKKRPILLIIIAVIAGICVLCIGASVAMNALGLVPTLTPTPLPSETPLPPATSTSTIQPSDTPRPTPTSTPTPLPPETQTAQAQALTQTQAAVNITATAQAQADIRTSTAQAKAEAATQIAQYQPIDRRELLTYADNHIGETVHVRITVFNINSDQELQGFFAGTFDALYVVMRDPFSGLYEDNIITVYGTVAGNQCGNNAFGAEVCQPMLIDAFYTK